MHFLLKPQVKMNRHIREKEAHKVHQWIIMFYKEATIKGNEREKWVMIQTIGKASAPDISNKSLCCESLKRTDFPETSHDKV